MKFNTKTKLFLAIFYLYLSIFSEINAFQSGLNLKRYRSKLLLKNSNRSRYPFKNPLGNFLAGLGEDLAQGDNGFLKCFPDAWKNGQDSSAASTVSGNLGGFAGGIQVFLNMAGPVIDFFCKNRETVINFLKNTVLKRKLRKYRLLLQSGNTRAARLMKKRWGLGDIGGAIKGAAGAVGGAVKGAAGAVGGFINDKIVSPIFNNFINPIKDKIVGVINKIKEFFASGIIDKVKNCIPQIKSAAGNIMQVVNGLKAKFNTLKTAIGFGPQALVIFAVDFIVALICDYKTLMTAITNFSTGLNAGDNNEKYYRYGKALGIMLKSFGLAQTFSESIINKIYKS